MNTLKSDCISTTANVITFCRINNPTFRPNFAYHDIVQFCWQVASQPEFAASPKHKLVFTSSVRQLNFLFDQKLLFQAITNLLSNAVKYSPDGGTIHLELVRKSSTINIHVRDEGIGIPPADEKLLFKPFFRASNVGSLKGIGLGLVTVKKIVELHNGQISFISRVGVGSVFSIILPTKLREE